MSRKSIVAALCFVVACSAEDGKDGTSFVTDLNDEPAGANCANGGVRIDTGPDKNGDGALAASEITKTNYVCAPDAGATEGAQIVKVFQNAGVMANAGTPVTVMSASVTTQGPGT